MLVERAGDRRAGRAEQPDRELPGLPRRRVRRPADRPGPPAGGQVRRRAAHHPRGRRPARPAARPGCCASATAPRSPRTPWCWPPGCRYRRARRARAGRAHRPRASSTARPSTEAPSCAGRTSTSSAAPTRPARRRCYFSRYARAGAPADPRRATCAASMSHYLIEQIDAIDNIEVHPHTEVVGAQGDGPPGAAHRCATRAPARPATVDTSVAVHLHRRGAAHRLAGRRAWSATSAASCVTGPDLLAERRRPAGWSLRRDPYHLESSVPGRVRRRRRAGRLGQAGRLGRRRGRDGGLAGAPLPGGAVSGSSRSPTRTRAALGPADPDELRTLFLFEALDDEQLDWLAEHGRVEQRAGRHRRLRRGRAGDLLLRAARRHGRAEPAGARRRRRGQPHRPARRLRAAPPRRTWATQRRRRSTATACARSPTPSSSCCRPTSSRTPCASGSRWRCTCWRACSSACATARRIVGERERLLALGSLSAGLTHELNNPAAAAVRATAVLRDRVAGMRHKLAMIADGRLDGQPPARPGRAAGGGGQAGRRRAPKLSADGRPATPRTTLADWLDEHDVDRRLGPGADAGRRRASTSPWLERGRRPRSARPTWSRRSAGSPTRSRPSC